MKVSRAQAAENRERVVDTAARLFREKGFDGIGLAELMGAAGLTHGGFYRNFASKDELAAEASARALDQSVADWQARIAERPQDALQALFDSYLSPRHRASPGSGCPLAALAGDAARGGGGIRQAFTRGLRGFQALIAPLLPGGAEALRQQRALATLSLLVGAMVLSRATEDEALSDEILGAARASLQAPDRAP
jgi:TetR/AcrR family transcriptional repressor of nem operon